MGHKHLIFGALAVCIAIALLIVLAKSPAYGRPTAGALETPPPDRSSVHNLHEVAPARTIVRPATLQVVDAQSKVPLPGAQLTAAPDRVQSTIEKPRDPTLSLSCDDDATVPVSKLQGAEQWLVSCPGYCACVTGRPIAATTIPLLPASALTVDITTENGGPQENALVQLRPTRVSATAVPEQNVILGSGDPRSTNPIWSARTDGLGKAVFDTIPAGSFRLIVRHEMSYPTSPEGQGAVDVDPPGIVFVRMRDLYAVCFAAPPGDRIERYSWELPFTGFDWDPAQYLSLALARGYLAGRFPEAVCRLGRPASSGATKELEVGCRALLGSHTLASGEWALSPIRMIETPVFLEPTPDRVARSVVIRITDVTGQELRMKVLLAGSSPTGKRPVQYSTRTNEPTVLEEGTYTVYPEAVPVWVEDDFRTMTFSITKDDPPDVEKTFRLRTPLRLLVVVPQPPVGPFVGFAHFAIRSEASRGAHGVMNWEPGRGPIECLMPIGNATIQVQSPDYRDETTSVDVVNGIGDQQVSLNLVKRGPNEPYGAGRVRPTRK